MFLCVWGIDFASFFDFDILFWNCFDGMVLFSSFILNLTVKLDYDLVLVCHDFIEKSQNNLGHDIAQIHLKFTLNTNQSNQSK